MLLYSKNKLNMIKMQNFFFYISQELRPNVRQFYLQAEVSI